jgi:hypothetical protein
MTTDRETLGIIGSWMEDGRTRLPDHVLDAVLDRLPSTPQRRPWWSARRIPHVHGLAKYAIAAAAVVVVAIVGLNLQGLGTGQPGGVGAQPSPSPSASPTATPTAPPTASSRPVGDGDLEPGSYVARPLPSPDDGLTVTYTVPEGWFAFTDVGLVPAGDPETGPPGGIAFQFMDVTTINGDPCRWRGTDDDISFGPEVDDLVAALREQTAYEVSEPIDVTIGGHLGKRVDVVMPTEPFTGQDEQALACDDFVFRPWNEGAGVYAQGPANRWQTNILDVDGTRLVIVVQDFPGTLPEDRAELDAIADSFVIER